jgi:hypothetical protein
LERLKKKRGVGIKGVFEVDLARNAGCDGLKRLKKKRGVGRFIEGQILSY